MSARTAMASEWLWGVRVVAEVLRGANRDAQSVWIENGPRHQGLEDIAAAAADRGVEVRHVERAEFAALDLRDAQRVAARCGPFRYRAEDDLPVAAPGSRGTLVVLDHIEDPQNTGAILRTAEVAGCRGVCLPARRAAQITPAVARASSGATEHLAIYRITNVARTIDRLKKDGYWTVALDGDGEQAWCEVDYRDSIVLVVGSEGRGVQRLVRERCDHRVALPRRGKVGSLNAGAAFAAVMYEVVRQQIDAATGR